MAALVLHWLNSELKLHRKVQILEQDLCNGYILAEILHIHGLEAHLERYHDGQELAARVANLEQLDKAMNAAGLGPLSASAKREVLMENRSTILQVLLRMKEFLEAKGKNWSNQHQKSKSTESRVYEPRSLEVDPAHAIQDSEERFVKETTQQYHPTEVRFYKSVNCAVHLRKFPQAQWQAENRRIELDKRLGVGNALQSAMSYPRKHMTNKREYMKKWNAERLTKWQATQRMYLEAERNDLRLELTLEERQRRHLAINLAGIENDAKIGVEGFEKNMMRLGLGGISLGGGVEVPLRAVPVCDSEEVTHLKQLEQQVEKLGFRPSNNIQMMRELRARRSTQLAAEKDRRLRRMKATCDMKKAVTAQNEASILLPADEPVSSMEGGVATASIEAANPGGPGGMHDALHDAFINTNKKILDAHYADLRVLGETKREAGIEVLRQHRNERIFKSHQRKMQQCAEIVDELIAFSIAAGECATGCDSKQAALLDRRSTPPICQDEAYGEATILLESFLNFSHVWEAIVDHNDAGDGVTCSSSWFCNTIESLTLSALATPTDEQLCNKWQPLAVSKFVALYTSDDQSNAIARQVATDHGLLYVNADELVEDCVKYACDPVKQANAGASLPERERDLGVLGSKIATLRQKSSSLPDALVVDVVLAAISSVLEPNIPTSDNADQSIADGGTGTVGFLLHNFPKTLDEWMLFEKGTVNAYKTSMDDDARELRIAAIDAGIDRDSEVFASSIACAIVLSPKAIPSTPAAGLISSSSGSELPSSTKRQLVVDPATVKAELELEAKQRRAQVEELLARTSRVIEIDQTDMHACALHEIIHLAIQVYSSPQFEERVGVLVKCSSHGTVPEELNAAREARRTSMSVQDRFAWMVAANQLRFNEQELVDFMARLRSIEQAQASNLLRYFAKAQQVLLEVTHFTTATLTQLDEILGCAASKCDAILDQATSELRSQPQRVPQILISTEVDLGDVVDSRRAEANRFIEERQARQDLSFLTQLQCWIQALPLVCLELKEYVVDTLAVLRQDFYTRVPFLRAESSASLPMVTVLDEFEESVTALEAACSGVGIEVSLHFEIHRLVGQLATQPLVFKQLNHQSLSPAASYDIAEEKVARHLVDSAIKRITAVLRWSTQLVECVSLTLATNVEDMRKYVSRDLRLSNQAISRVMMLLAEKQPASWPEKPVRDGCLHVTLSRHHQAACLSVAQIDTLITAFRAADGDSGESLCPISLARQQFITVVVDVARRQGFPGVWQDYKHVARVAIAWSSTHNTRLSWRHFIMSVLCAQALGFPTTQAIEDVADQLRRMLYSSSSREGAETRISKDQFFQVKLWFEDDEEHHDEAERWKSVLFSVFATDAKLNEAAVLQMLFTWCMAPSHPRGVRRGLASRLLPQFSRGLRRAFSSMSRWVAAGGSQYVGVAEVRQLMAFAGVDADETSPFDSNDTDPLSLRWELNEADRFLAWCDANDHDIASHFMAHDTLAVLIDD